jgi:hypothetical protein
MSDKHELMKLLSEYGEVVFESVDASKLKTGTFTNIHKPFDLTDPTDTALLESIRKSGLASPLITDEDYNLIDGHRRLEALKVIYGSIEKIPKLPVIRVKGINCEKNRLGCLKIAYVVNEHRRETDEAQILAIINEIVKELGCQLIVGREVNQLCVDSVVDALGGVSIDRERVLRLVHQMIASTSPALVVKPNELEVAPPKPTAQPGTEIPDEVITKIMTSISRGGTSEATVEEQPEEQTILREHRRLMTEFGRELVERFNLTPADISHLLTFLKPKEPDRVGFINELYVLCINKGLCPNPDEQAQRR